ncbi:hypothetical protein [Phaffia rhodozyma]|uniref:Uncharacterized protein n=1 Tax=Phaffia rhodozyma TaxID=264483 RepID=A0A0F7SQV5_PHARH|nr:hypothetical protein [Phaffia rhodozyma]
MANAPQPDYSAAWAQYYAHQAANAQAQAQGAPTAGPAAPAPAPPPAQAYSQPSQQPYSYPQPAGPSYPGPQSYNSSQPAYQVRPSYPQQPPHHHHHQPQHQQPPPYRSQPPPLPPSLPSVGPQAYPSQGPYGSPNQPYQIGASAGSGGGGRYPSGQGPPSVSGGGGGGSSYHPSVRPSPMSAPHHISNSSSMGGGSGGGPGGSSGGFNQPAGFPPAKRPRFDSHSAGGTAGGGLSPAPVPGLPLNPLITAAVVNAERAYNSRESGSEFFSGGDGRDGLSMGMASRGTSYRGRGTVSRGGSTRGGYVGSSSNGGSGGVQDDDDYSGGGSSYRGRGRGRGISRSSPPPMGMSMGMGSGMPMGMSMNGGLPMSSGGRGGIGMNNGIGSGMRGDRGGYRGRGMRGAAYSSSHPRADYAPHDAPRGPSSTRYHARASLGNVPPKKDTPTGTPVVPRAKMAKEEGPKQTFTDFKIIGLEVPELSWKWGVVDREDEVEGGNGRKRKADAGSEDPNQGSPTQASTIGQPPSKHRSYFKTHGKANPDRIEEVSKEISRLRLYFDSPAGAGPGESKRRGGIEGGERKQSAAKLEDTPSIASSLLAASAVTTTAVSAPASAISAPSSNAEETEEDQKEDSTEQEPEQEEESETAKDSASNIDGEEIEDLSMRGSAEPEVEPSNPEEQSTVVPTEAETEPEAEIESQIEVQIKPVTNGKTDTEEEPSEAARDQDAGANEPQETDGNEVESSEVLALLQTSQPEEPSTSEQPSVPQSQGEIPQQEQSLTCASASILTSAPSTAPTAMTTSSLVPSEESQHPIPSSAPSPTKSTQDTSLATSKTPNAIATPTSASTPNPTESTKPSPTLYTGPEPSPDRVSILYERCTRRLCIDAGVIERVRISRAEGKVEFTIRWRKGLEQEKTEQEKIKEEEDTTTSTTEVTANPPDEAPSTIKVEEIEGGSSMKLEANETAAPVENSGDDDTTAAATASDATLAEVKTEVVEKNEQPTEPVKEEKSTPALVDDTAAEKPSENGLKVEEPKDDRVWDICRGILMELLEEETDHFQPVVLDTLEDMWDEVEDPCAGWTPPIHKLISPDSPQSAQFPTLKTDTFKLIAYLDQEKPLSEPKWVKAGKAEEFLLDTFGPSSKGHAKDWRGHKFEVLDPEEAPLAPTIHSSLDSWATNSTVGTARERRRFVKLHLVEMDRISDILLRVVNPSTPTSSAASSAMGQSVSTAVSAVLKMAVEMAVKAGVPTETVNDRVAEIIRALPQQVLFRGVDSLFKEWLADKRP